MTKRRIRPNHYIFWSSQIAPFGDSHFATQVLSGLKGVSPAMDDLRGILLESREATDASYFSDDQVLTEIARLISRDELLIAWDRTTKLPVSPNHCIFWRSQIARFRDSKSAIQFLSAVKVDARAMSDLRGLLFESRLRIDVSRLTDDQVLAEIARLIWLGHLVVANDREGRSGASSQPAGPTQIAQTPAGVPVRSGPQSQEPEPATLPSNLNSIAQAAALSAAAANGTPFCAQCAAAAAAGGQ
jgi:hypothetical protein